MPTLLHRLARWAEESPSSPAQRYKSNGEWKTITTKELRDRVYHLALFFQAKGVAPGECGAIFSYNCPEWVHAELAMTMVRARSAGLYPNSSAKDIEYILNHTEATVLSIQNLSYYEKITSEKGEAALPSRLKLVFVFEGNDTSISKAVTYKTAIEEGKQLANAPGAKKFSDFLDALDPKSGSFMIYTSGTTGNPKGAVLSHDNLAHSADVVAAAWKLPYSDGTLFSFLPLCHIAEKLQNLGVGLTQRYVVNFATSFDQVSKELPQVQPTLLLSVPRLWEKMMEGVVHKVAQSEGIKKIMGTLALETGMRIQSKKWAGETLTLIDQVQYEIADRLVLAKIREAMGLNRIKVMASGAAALSAHVAKWFRGLNLEILECYGQTESSAICCLTIPGVECAGTVGKAPPGTEFKLESDGEILTRGRHVFVGYFRDDAATQSVMENGWLKTGDLGEITEKGLVRIKGRKKEIMKTSGGKMIAPVPIEEELKVADIISQACLVGDGRKFIAALFTLSEGTLKDIQNKPAATDGLLVVDKEILAKIKAEVDRVNARLAGYEQIKQFRVLSREFSVADQEMTPTLKMKRAVIESHFKDIIDGMFGGRD